MISQTPLLDSPPPAVALEDPVSRWQLRVPSSESLGKAMRQWGAGGWSQKVGEMMVVDGYFTMKKGGYGSRLLQISYAKRLEYMCVCVCGLM